MAHRNPSRIYKYIKKKTFRKPSLCSKSKNIQQRTLINLNLILPEEDMALAMLGLLTPSFTVPKCEYYNYLCILLYIIAGLAARCLHLYLHALFNLKHCTKKEWATLTIRKGEMYLIYKITAGSPIFFYGLFLAGLDLNSKSDLTTASA